MFYIYEWFIVDTLEVFYVGKGTDVRRFELHNRNQYFYNVYNKHHCAVRIVEQGLTNEQACELEQDRIAMMWVKGWAKCNLHPGGTGFAPGAMNPNRINPPKGEKNPMYGIRLTGNRNPFYGRKHSDKTKFKISASRKGKGARFGKDNPMYGKGFKGKDNPMYGRTGVKHHNSVAYKVTYPDGNIEILHAKGCELKFGIAFTRIRGEGGLLHYKKKTPNDIYEGTTIEIYQKV